MSYDTKDGFTCFWNLMADEVTDVAIRKGWWDSGRSEPEIIALIHAELSEVLEALRQPDPHAPDPKCSNFSSVEVELADVVIRVMDYARMRGYRVAEAVGVKHEYNRTRPHKHGGKRF